MKCGARIPSAWICAPSMELGVYLTRSVTPRFVKTAKHHTFPQNVQSVFWSVEPGLQNKHFEKNNKWNMFWSVESGFNLHETLRSKCGTDFRCGVQVPSSVSVRDLQSTLHMFLKSVESTVVTIRCVTDPCRCYPTSTTCNCVQLARIWWVQGPQMDMKGVIYKPNSACNLEIRLSGWGSGNLWEIFAQEMLVLCDFCS